MEISAKECSMARSSPSQYVDGQEVDVADAVLLEERCEAHHGKQCPFDEEARTGRKGLSSSKRPSLFVSVMRRLDPSEPRLPVSSGISSLVDPFRPMEG